MALRIEQDAAGATVPIVVHPAARRNRIAQGTGGGLKAEVTAAPEKGKANRALIELIHRLTGVSRSQIELVAGTTSRSKRLRFRGWTSEQLSELLQGIVAGDSGSR